MTYARIDRRQAIVDHLSTTRPRSCLALHALAACLALVASGAHAATGEGDAEPYDYYVAPHGDDGHRGDDWRRPLRTIQRALDLARPGERVGVGAGDYHEDLRSVRDGTPDSPIRLVGTPGAVIRGAGRARVVEIRHSHLELSHLEVDGEVKRRGEGVDYRDKLIYVMGRDERAGITGVRLLGLSLRNAAGECVRLKYFAHGNELAYSSVKRCGIEDFERGGNGKNGEAVYIGTAPEQLDRNPTRRPDRSDGNWIHHNRFDTQGNECVDVKEGAERNLIERNWCTGQRDERAGGISIRGNRNVVRFNAIGGNRGAGVRLGGDGEQDGVGNEVYGNILWDNAFAAFKIMRRPQGRLCGNTVRADGTRITRGKHAEDVDPSAPCERFRPAQP